MTALLQFLDIYLPLQTQSSYSCHAMMVLFDYLVKPLRLIKCILSHPYSKFNYTAKVAADYEAYIMQSR